MIRLCAILPTHATDETLRMAERLHIWGTGVSFPAEATEADAWALGRRFAAAGLHIVQVGDYVNLSSPLPEARARAVAHLTRSLRLAAAAGCPAVVTGAGHCDPSCPDAIFSAHPENWAPSALDRLVQTCREVVEAAADTGVRLLVEPWVMSPLASLNNAGQAVRRVGHPGFGILFDPVNLMNLDTYFDNGSFLRRAVQQLGSAIGLVHAKDTRLHPERFTFHMAEEPVGQGALDYPALLGALAALPGDVPLCVEHVHTEAEVAAALGHLRRVSEQVGIPLGEAER